MVPVRVQLHTSFSDLSGCQDVGAICTPAASKPGTAWQQSLRVLFFFYYYLPVVLGWALDPGVQRAISLSHFPSKMSSMWLFFFFKPKTHEEKM